MPTRTLLTDLFDLVLGRCCLGCERVGPTLCPACLAAMRGDVRTLPPSPRLPTVVAAAPYDGLPRRAILDYKEHGNRGLAPMLGTLLADAVATQLHHHGASAGILVPVPSHRHAARGYDALGAIAAAAVRHLDSGGASVAVRRPLRSAAAYRPLKGLGRDDRRTQVSGAFRPGPWSRGLADAGPVILVDDVLTSGATAGEAVRALGCVGIRVDGIAVIAAVSRDRSARIPAPAPPRSRR